MYTCNYSVPYVIEAWDEARNVSAARYEEQGLKFFFFLVSTFIYTRARDEHVAYPRELVSSAENIVSWRICGLLLFRYNDEKNGDKKHMDNGNWESHVSGDLMDRSWNDARLFIDELRTIDRFQTIRRRLFIFSAFQATSSTNFQFNFLILSLLPIGSSRRDRSWLISSLNELGSPSVLVVVD